MSKMAKSVMQRFYRDADGDPTQLPWHQTTAPALLDRALQLHPAARALDVGCGSGVFALHMASRGAQVTAIDYLPEAVAMAEHQTADADIDVQQADVFTFHPPAPYDVVFDSGCMHNFGRADLDRYGATLTNLLAPGGHLVLCHWAKRHALDWRPIGPRRRTIMTIERAFGPSLTLVDADYTEENAPFPFGPKIRCGTYLFARND